MMWPVDIGKGMLTSTDLVFIFRAKAPLSSGRWDDI